MDSTERRNVESVRRQIAWLNAHDINGFLSVLADDFIWKSDVLPKPDVGIEGAREGLETIYDIFPNIHFEELDIYPSGDSVIGVFKVSGTEIGRRLKALLPSVNDHPWHVNQAIIHTFDRNGKMKMIWLFTNVAYLLQQLGVLPGDLTTFGEAIGKDSHAVSSGFPLEMNPVAPSFEPLVSRGNVFNSAQSDRLGDIVNTLVRFPIMVLYESVMWLDRWIDSSDSESLSQKDELVKW